MNSKDSEISFLSRGGEMGQLIRSINWAHTPLGHPQDWPEALKHTVSMMLSTTFPVLICWGEQYIQLYNDAFRPINGETKHPRAMGGRAKDIYTEAWQTIGPMFQGVMEGKAVGFSDFNVPLDRNGHIEECYFDFSYSPIYNLDGTIGGVLVICTETTEKVLTRNKLEQSNQEVVAANEELQTINEEMTAFHGRLEQTVGDLSQRESELNIEKEKLGRFFMQAPAGICILDGPELIYELINPLYQQLFPGRELIGQPLLKAIPELSGTSIVQILDDVYRTGKSFEGNELLIPLPRGEGSLVEDRYFNFIYQARYDAKGGVDGILVFVIEVTEMVMIRRRVEESAQRFRAQLNAIPQIAFTCKPTGEVDYCNQQWYDYTGLDEEVLLANGWDQVVHPDDRQYNMQSYRRVLAGETGGEWEVRNKRFDGEFRWHLTRVLPIKHVNGKIEHWIGTATDIHDLKTLQQQKDDFISIASHELKTPVTSLKASLQIVDRMKDNPTPMLPKLISQANKSMVKITALIEDLLDASKVNESQLHLRKTSFNVSELLNGCCDHVRVEGKHQLIFKGDSAQNMFADEHRIDQVVVNFVNNAVKYAPNSKEIYLMVEKLEGKIKIAVKDSGPGVSPEKIPHLFTRYYRAEYTGNQYSGLGLGLYISSEIIKRHGGEIGVDSVVGKGSTFWFTIPDFS